MNKRGGCFFDDLFAIYSFLSCRDAHSFGLASTHTPVPTPYNDPTFSLLNPSSDTFLLIKLLQLQLLLLHLLLAPTPDVLTVHPQPQQRQRGGSVEVRHVWVSGWGPRCKFRRENDFALTFSLSLSLDFFLR